MRFLDNVLQGFIDNAGTDFAKRDLCRHARALGRPRRHGLPLLPAAEQHPARSGDGQGVEQEDVQAHPRPVRPGVEDARRRSAAPARMPPTSASRSASPTSWRSRRPRRSRSSAAAPRPASSRRRPTSTTTRRCRAPSWCATRTSRSCWPRRAGTTRTPGPRSPSRQGSVQHLDCLDDHEKAVFKTAFEIDQRWLVEHAADRTPYHLPEPVAQHLPAGRRAQARPAPDPHDGVEARREDALLLPLALHPARRHRRPARRSRAPLGDHALSAPRLDAPCRPSRPAAGRSRPTTTTKSA